MSAQQTTPANLLAGATMSNESSMVTCWQWLQSHYRAIVVCDFEFNGGIGDNPVMPSDNEGNIPNVVCGVFLNLFTGEKVQFWQGEFPEKPPFGTGPDILWVGYMSSAEWGSLLCTRLKSLNALSLRVVVIGNLFRCSIQRRNSLSARPVFWTRRNTIMLSST